MSQFTHCCIYRYKVDINFTDLLTRSDTLAINEVLGNKIYSGRKIKETEEKRLEGRKEKKNETKEGKREESEQKIIKKTRIKREVIKNREEGKKTLPRERKAAKMWEEERRQEEDRKHSKAVKMQEGTMHDAIRRER